MIFIADSSGNLIGADTQRFHGIWAKVDVDFTATAAQHIDSPHTPHIFESLLDDLLGVVGELYQADALFVLLGDRNNGQGPNGSAGGVKSNDAGFFDFVTQCGPHARHFFPHIVGRFATIHVELEFNDHHRLVFIAARSERIDTRDGVDAFFNFFGDFALNNFG